MNEKSGMFQWVAIHAFKKANIEKSFKNLDRSDKNEGFTKRENARKNKKNKPKKACNACFAIAHPKYP